ncbi:MAG TPA: hypothetical protein VF507_00775, partial [Pyrinomonadaceae bacterium]
MEKINKAPSLEAKKQAIQEFLQKYPNSTLRPKLAENVVNQIAGVKEPAQKITLGEEFLRLFNQPGEADMIVPMLVEAYVAAGRIDDAFAAGSKLVERRPEEIYVLATLTLQGANQALRGNPKFSQQSKQFGAKVVGL